MDKELWFWQYEVLILEERKQKIRSGLCVGDTMSEVVSWLEGYYGDELMELHMLKPVIEGVFEFDFMSKDDSFDFTISRKDCKGE